MILGRGEFWIGLIAGVALLYFWQRYQAGKAAQ